VLGIATAAAATGSAGTGIPLVLPY
jgi:hypothetical protein